MTLEKVTDRSAVLSAIDECNDLGKVEFLSLYGYQEAKTYVVVHDGSRYDSKAIWGAAYKFQHGRMLAFDDFHGGLREVVKPLRALGFEVLSKKVLQDLETAIGKSVKTRSPRTFISLWNPKNWEWDAESRSRIQHEIREDGVSFGDWAFGKNRGDVQDGDRIFMQKVGVLPRGIIAAGRVLGPTYSLPHWDPEKEGEFIFYVDIAWEVLLDEKTLLLKETLGLEIPSKNWTILSNGTSLQADHADDLESLWRRHLKNVAANPGIAVSTVGARIDADVEIERGYTTATVKKRKHQRKFRLLLLSATAHPECFVCGFDELELLEAAHIIPDSKGGPSSLKNGRLLCLNHHRAHDTDMFRFVNDEPQWGEGVRPFGAPEDWPEE